MSETPIVDFFPAHRTLSIVILAACVFLSFCIIAQLWFTHRRDSTLRKLLLVVRPASSAAWLIFYGGFIVRRRRPRMKVMLSMVALPPAVRTPATAVSVIIEDVLVMRPPII